jgi:hypothetical protein
VREALNRKEVMPEATSQTVLQQWCRPLFQANGAFYAAANQPAVLRAASRRDRVATGTESGDVQVEQNA